MILDNNFKILLYLGNGSFLNIKISESKRAKIPLFLEGLTHALVKKFKISSFYVLGLNGSRNIV